MKPVNPLEAVPAIANLSNEERAKPENMVYGTCEKCGAELRHGEYKLGDKMIYPKLACNCEIKSRDKQMKIEERKRQTAEMQKYTRRHLINPKIINAGFKNFVTRPGTENMLENAKQFFRDFESEEDGRVFFGAPGNGKSHLARAIQRSLEADGWATLFFDWPQLIELAKETFSKKEASINNIIRAAIDADLLVLDEIGFLHLTEWEAKALLFPIINGRQGKKTILTTNLNIDELEEWFMFDKDGNPLDEKGRIFDRLIGSYRFVENKGTSKRKEDRMRAMGRV